MMQALRAQDVQSRLKKETIDIPEIGPRDVLVQVAAAGITPGVVKMLQAGRSHVPSTVGHEVAGTVASIGEEVQSVSIGDRVRLHPNLSCGECYHCTASQDQMCDKGAMIGFARFGKESNLYDRYHNGGLAEYIMAPYWLIDKIPDNMSFEVGAKLHDIATASRALKVADFAKDSVLVLTAPTGTMGVLTLRLAHLYPIKKIILVGRSKERLQSIEHLTPIETHTLAIDPDDMEKPYLVSQLKSLAPEGIDTIIDYFPSGGTISRILPALRTGGTLVHMGGNVDPLRIPLMVIMSNCWKILGSRGNRRNDVRECIEWLSRGNLKVDDLVTHRFSFEQVDEAMELFSSRSEPVWLGVIGIRSEK